MNGLRQLIAFACATGAGFALGLLIHVNAVPFAALDNPVSWTGRMLGLLIVGCATAAVAALVSGEHTPGLPGLAYAVTLAGLGASRPDPWADGSGPAGELWTSYIFQAFCAVIAGLGAYITAWAVDVFVVLPRTGARRAPRDPTTGDIVTGPLPCLVVSACLGGAATYALTFRPLVGIAVSFAVAAFAASILFRVRSTIWYAMAAPVALTLLGTYVLNNQDRVDGFSIAMLGPLAFLQFSGAGSAGALMGHLMWRACADAAATHGRLNA